MPLKKSKIMKTNPLYLRLLLSEWFYAATQLYKNKADEIQEEIETRKQEFEKEKPVRKIATPISKTPFPFLAFALGLVFLFVAVLFIAIIGINFLRQDGYIHLAIMFFVLGGIATVLAIWQIARFISRVRGFMGYKKSVKDADTLNARYYSNYKNECVLYEKRKVSFQESVLKPLYAQRDQAKNNYALLNKAFNHSMNFIYSSYRNIICVCQFTQYIESGRCESFEGPHGCYNLFESELRMSIIINQLDIVISKMDEIIANQHEIVSLLKSIEATTKAIKKDTEAIAMNTAITALASLEIAGSIENVSESVAKVNSNINDFDMYYRRYH